MLRKISTNLIPGSSFSGTLVRFDPRRKYLYIPSHPSICRVLFHVIFIVLVILAKLIKKKEKRRKKEDSRIVGNNQRTKYANERGNRAMRFVRKRSKSPRVKATDRSECCESILRIGYLAAREAPEGAFLHAQTQEENSSPPGYFPSPPFSGSQASLSPLFRSREKFDEAGRPRDSTANSPKRVQGNPPLSIFS